MTLGIGTSINYTAKSPSSSFLGSARQSLESNRPDLEFLLFLIVVALGRTFNISKPVFHLYIEFDNNSD